MSIIDLLQYYHMCLCGCLACVALSHERWASWSQWHQWFSLSLRLNGLLNSQKAQTDSQPGETIDELPLYNCHRYYEIEGVMYLELPDNCRNGSIKTYNEGRVFNKQAQLLERYERQIDAVSSSIAALQKRIESLQTYADDAQTRVHQLEIEMQDLQQRECKWMQSKVEDIASTLKIKHRQMKRFIEHWVGSRRAEVDEAQLRLDKIEAALQKEAKK